MQMCMLRQIYLSSVIHFILMENETLAVRGANKEVHKKSGAKPEGDASIGEEITEAMQVWPGVKQKRKKMPYPKNLLKRH